MRAVRALGLLAVAATASGCVRLGAPADPAKADQQVANAEAQIGELVWGQSILLERGDFGDAWKDSDDADFTAVSSRSVPAVFSCLGITAAEPDPSDTVPTPGATTSLATISVQGRSNVYFRDDFAYVISASAVASDLEEAEAVFSRATASGFGDCVAERSTSGAGTAASDSRPRSSPPVADERVAYRLDVTQLRKGVATRYTVDLFVLRYERAIAALYVARPTDGDQMLPSEVDALAVSLAKRAEEQKPAS